MNKQVKINLLKLNQAFIMNVQGKSMTKKCVCIPVDDNGVYVTEKGAYLNAMAWENREKESGEPVVDEYGNSHRIVLSLPKEMREQMTEEEVKEKTPIIGNLSNTSKEKVENIPTMVCEDDLPF